MSKVSTKLLESLRKKAQGQAGTLPRRVVQIQAGERAERWDVLRSGVCDWDVEVAAGACLRWAVGREAGCSASFRSMRVKLAQGASFELAQGFTLDAGCSHGEKIEIIFAGPGAKATLTSRWAQSERSTLCQESLGAMGPFSAGAIFEQSSKALRLGDGALSLIEPNLRVEIDDVSASHGAAHGPIDELALHALRARGLPDDTSRSMLAQAFVEEAWLKMNFTEIDRKKLLLPEVEVWN